MSSSVCTYDKLPWPKSEVHYAMHSHTLHADTEDPSKNLHILFPCSLFQNFVHALKLKFHIMQKFSKLNNNKIWREHMAQILILKTLNKFLFNYFSLLSQKRLQFSPPGSIWAWQEVMISEVKIVSRVLQIKNPLFWPDNVVHLYNIKLFQKLQDDLSATTNQSLVFLSATANQSLVVLSAIANQSLVVLSAIANQSLVFPLKQWFLLRRRTTTMVLFHWD